MSGAADLLTAFGALQDALPSDSRQLVVALAEPSRAVAPIAPSDPARLGYPPTFPFEIAMRTSGTRQICEAYHITEDEWELIRNDPSFLADLQRAVDVLSEEGMSFKIKAKLQAEELLKTSWRTIHDVSTPPSVRADLIKATMRWAEYDTPPSGKADMSLPGGGTRAFQINIQFNNQVNQRGG